MQKCNNCNAPFSWGKVYRSFWGWVYKPITCDNCGVMHQITVSGRLAFVSVTILPMLIYVNFLSTFENIFLTIGIGIILLLVGSLLSPFLVKFKSKGEV